MAKDINLTIDGQPVAVPSGTLIVDAAKKIGIDIPVFCYHPKMEPVGMCRMCLVEVGRPVIDRTTSQVVLDESGNPKLQFGPKLETACTTPVSDGMVVIGMSDKVKHARNDVLEFLLTSHPLDCPICDKGGECPLQNLTMGFGPGESRYNYEDKQHLAKHVPLGELIYLDRERCIQCGRCVRFQKEIVDDPVIGFYNRGRALEISTNSDPGFDSIFSGNTTDICPVGALTTADFRFGARPWELKNAASICTHCPVGCNITFDTRREVKTNGKVVIKRTLPRQNESVNEIWICDKGRFGYHFTESNQRLTTPLLRKNGELQPVTWEEAIDTVSEKIRAHSFNFTVLAGGRLSNEDLYSLKELADTVQGRSLLYSTMAGGDLVARVGLGSKANLGTLGTGAVIVVAASDLHEEAPIWWLRVKNAVRRGAKLVVVNARDTRLDKFALFTIRYPYGKEAEAILSLLPDSPVADDLNKLIADAEELVVFYGSDGTGYESSKRLATASAQLIQKTGHAGKENSGLVAVWQHANDQGAWDIGFQPDPHFDTILEHAGVIYIAGADPAGDCPDCRKAMERSNFVVVQELFLTETAKLADVVLPAQAFTERDGSLTNGERRVQRFFPIVDAPEGTLPDYAIAARVKQKIARMNLDINAASQVFMALAIHTPDYVGLTYQKLSQSAEQWPIIGRKDLYYGGTSYDNHQGLGVKLATTAEHGQRLEIPDVEPPGTPFNGDSLVGYPITLAYDRGTTVTPSTLLAERLPEPFILLHPETVKNLGLTVGLPASLHMKGQSYRVIIREDESVPVNAVLTPRSLGLPALEPVLVQVTKSQRG
jgi:NADH-quinone oxidoreductase subunit G